MANVTEGAMHISCTAETSSDAARRTIHMNAYTKLFDLHAEMSLVLIRLRRNLTGC
jgi:hypothetical protein